MIQLLRDFLKEYHYIFYLEKNFRKFKHFYSLFVFEGICKLV